ncbi:myeloid-associated differentiation marker [Bos mutus]|uniref:myeloid-associated differentiation marker n=1 Tax=Bos mutus TaxID=72004 RepID=UPI0038B46422
MVTEPRPEDDHVVMWITEIRMAVVFVKELRKWIESDNKLGTNSGTVRVTPQPVSQPVSLLRLPQFFSTCMSFSLVADMGIHRGYVGNWFMSIWCFCCAVTLIVLTVELRRFPSEFPFFWYLSNTYACYAALFCLSASIIYSLTYVQFLPYGPHRDQAIAVTAFSCIASVFYAMEVVKMWERCKIYKTSCYVLTVPGLLKVLETFMAGIIFAFISNTSLYLHQPALEWCVAVYSICFIPAALAILLNLEQWEYRLPGPFPLFQLVLSLLSILLYISALVLWLLYQFNKEFGGHPQRSSDEDCKDELAYDMCAWDQRLAVAILTAANLLVYVTELGYWACQVSVETKALPRVS